MYIKLATGYSDIKNICKSKYIQNTNLKFNTKKLSITINSVLVFVARDRQFNVRAIVYWERIWLTALTIQLALIPYFSRSSALFPDLGTSCTANFFTVMSRQQATAEHTASPRPPVVIETVSICQPVSWF